MYKNIMVAIDGSETSRDALAEAENIANSYNAALCIIHAIAGDDEADKKAGTDLLEQAKSSISNSHTEVRLVQAENEFGLTGTSDAIAAAAVDWKADLLVVGTANRRGLKRFVIGSVAEQLVASIKCSVLLVRPK